MWFCLAFLHFLDSQIGFNSCEGRRLIGKNGYCLFEFVPLPTGNTFPINRDGVGGEEGKYMKKICVIFVAFFLV